MTVTDQRCNQDGRQRPLLDRRQTAVAVRRHILRVAASAQGCHVGGSLSVVEIIVAIFDILGTDAVQKATSQFILSKGHAAPALYGLLVELGALDAAELDGYGAWGSRLAAHPTRRVPGVGVPTGSLGHGLAVGLGLAIASPSTRVFVVMGDGELQEGSVWEAAMSASKLGVTNLLAVVDNNRLQLNGPTRSDCSDMWHGCGWDVADVDGHDLAALDEVFRSPRVRPTAVVAHTIKGKGIKSFENRSKAHFVKLSSARYGQLLAEIERLESSPS